MKLLKQTEVKLLANNYLVNGEDSPVYNEEFVSAQMEAHKLVKTAEAVKGANFEQKKVDKFEDIVAKVKKEIEQDKVVSYVSTPTEPDQSATKTLAQEALLWLKFEDTKKEADKTNAHMQRFNVLKEFEEIGLFFNNEKLVKLPKIYTTSEILEAVKVLTPHLK